MKRTAKGFTLVEIMIVVAIIGILIAIAVPGFIKARETSRNRACQENQTKIDGAIQQYILENNEKDLDTSALQAGGLPLLIGADNFLKSEPKCPSDGIYAVRATAGAVGEGVSCTVHVFPTGDPVRDNLPGS